MGLARPLPPTTQDMRVAVLPLARRHVDRDALEPAGLARRGLPARAADVRRV